MASHPSRTKDNTFGSDRPGAADADPLSVAVAEREMFETLAEAIPEAAYLFDALRDESGAVIDFTFRYVNRAAESLLGRPRESLLGERLCELYPFHRSLNLFEDYVRVFNTGEAMRREIAIPVPSGARWYWQDVAPTATGIAISGRDITREKLTDKAQREVERRAQQAQHMESLGMLVGGVAHDFNNILLAISGFTRVAMLSESAEKRRHALQEIEHATSRAANLTKQLLGLGGRRKHVRRAVRLNQLVSDSLGLLRNVLAPKAVLETSLGADDLTLMGDETQLLQVLVNLSVNGRDAMCQGGKLTIKTEEVRIDGSERLAPGQQDGAYARITVSDTGEGMDEATQRRIFEPFFTTKDVGEGTGLGLSLVYSIVERHGGFIEVHSAPGQGTTFVIDLPLGVSYEPLPQDSDETSVEGGSETVLIVDDESAVRVLVAAALQRAGYRTLVATGGREALEVYRRYSGEVDIVLLDAVMPEMDGKRCYDALYDMDPNVRVLFSTGYERDIFPSGFFGDGKHSLLRKPYDIATLLGALRSVLDRRRDRA